MTDHLVCRVGESFALGADDIQWIVYRARYHELRGDPMSFKNWVGVSFVRSGKDILLRCFREKGCDPAALADLADLPATFDQWKVAQRPLDDDTAV